MSWSTNAENIYAFELNRVEPLRIPGQPSLGTEGVDVGAKDVLVLVHQGRHGPDDGPGGDEVAADLRPLWRNDAFERETGRSVQAHGFFDDGLAVDFCVLMSDRFIASILHDWFASLTARSGEDRP